MKFSRLRAGSTQTELAEKLRVPRPYLSMLEAGRTGWMDQATVVKLLGEYAQLRPVDLGPVREALRAIAGGASPKDSVEEAFLVEPKCYAAARADVSVKQVAGKLNLSVTVVRRFEACEVRSLATSKVALLATYYAGLAGREGPSVHITDDETVDV